MSAPQAQDPRRVQALGKALLTQLFMALRTLRLHDRNNQSALVATEKLKDTLNTVYGQLGEVRLEIIEETPYLSGHRLALDRATREAARALAQELAACKLGGLSFSRPVTTRDLTELLLALNRAASPAVDGAAEVRDSVAALSSLAVELLGPRRFQQAEERVVKVDPRLLSLQTYAKAILAMRRFVSDVTRDTPPEQMAHPLKLIRIVQDLVDLADQQVNLLPKLTAIKDCVDYQSNHAVNVCVMAVALGRALGLQREDLVDLGMAGLTSDLGFSLMSPELLDKSGRLTAAELDQVREHIFKAVRVLVGKGTLSRGPMRRLIVAFQHHMHYDLQGGYPQLDAGRPLHLFSRIVAVCDSYDALTTNRPYREAYGPDEALRLMQEEAGTKLDPVLVKVLINLLGVYPLGTAVRLDSGEIGVVYHTADDPARYDRPIVRVVRDAAGRPVERSVLRDLSRRGEQGYLCSIVETLPPEDLVSEGRTGLFSEGPGPTAPFGHGRARPR